MQGMSRATGAPLAGDSHLIQSIHDLLTTPLGSRVMLPDYGSRLPDLVDQPQNALFEVDLYAATAEALAKWEPRFKLARVQMGQRSATGRITIAIEGTIVADGSQVRLEGITL